MCIGCHWANYRDFTAALAAGGSGLTRRQALRRGAAFAASAMAVSAAPAIVADAVAAPDANADIVFRNGPVYTVDGRRPWARAVAVKGKRIAFVGDDAGVESLIGPQTRVVDLAGKMLLPGFVEGHIHPLVGATLTRGRTFSSTPGKTSSLRSTPIATRSARWISSAASAGAISPFRRPARARRIWTRSGPMFPSSCSPSTRTAPGSTRRLSPSPA